MTYRRHGKTFAAEAHIVQGSGGRYRMEYLSPDEARGRIVFSDGRTNWQYEPARKVLEKTTLSVMSEQKDRDLQDLIESNYRIEMVSQTGQAAGRPTYVVDLVPKHSGKSSQRRWIDHLTFKTLRLETHYTDGILARMISYERVSLPAVVTDADFQPMHTNMVKSVGPAPLTVSTATRTIPSQYSDLALAPQAALGFRLVEISASSIEGNPATQLLYTDGIETVSVFAQKGAIAASAPPKGWGPIVLKATKVYENVDHHVYALAWTRGKYRYTAVSHLTPDALQTFVAGQL